MADMRGWALFAGTFPTTVAIHGLRDQQSRLGMDGDPFVLQLLATSWAEHYGLYYCATVDEMKSICDRTEY